MTIDINDFNLNTSMEQNEYMHMKLCDLTEDFLKQYNLTSKYTKDSYVDIETSIVINRLPQSGILAQQLLEKRLNTKGYRQIKLTPGFCKHDWRPISFTLCVENFGVKYVVK